MRRILATLGLGVAATAMLLPSGHRPAPRPPVAAPAVTRTHIVWAYPTQTCRIDAVPQCHLTLLNGVEEPDTDANWVEQAFVVPS